MSPQKGSHTPPGKRTTRNTGGKDGGPNKRRKKFGGGNNPPRKTPKAQKEQMSMQTLEDMVRLLTLQPASSTLT